jgi:hypothetical protein
MTATAATHTPNAGRMSALAALLGPDSFVFDTEIRLSGSNRSSSAYPFEQKYINLLPNIRANERWQK